MMHDFRVVTSQSAPFAYEVQTTRYRYEVQDRLGREIVAYHWHPVSQSPVTYPHLHLSGRLPPLDVGPRDDPIALGKIHLPTGGLVTLTDVVRLLITEFGVAPRRPDWAAVLEAVGDPLAPER